MAPGLGQDKGMGLKERSVDDQPVDRREPQAGGAVATSENGLTRLDYLMKQYENILGWYKQSEEKAKFVITVNTLAAGIVNGLAFFGIDKAEAVRSTYGVAIWTMLALAGLALVGSCLFTLRVIWARHRRNERPLKRTEKLWFFGHIAAMSPDEYLESMRNWSESVAEETFVAQNHLLAANVKVKFDALNRAITLTVVALILLFGLGVAYAVAMSNAPSR